MDELSDRPLLVGKWALGRSKSEDLTMLRLEFADRPPIILAIPAVTAEAIAMAIREQTAALEEMQN